MNRKFEPTSPLQRVAFAAAAMFAAFVTVGSVAALAEHYSVVAQLSGAAPLVIAVRQDPPAFDAMLPASTLGQRPHLIRPSRRVPVSGELP